MNAQNKQSDQMHVASSGELRGVCRLVSFAIVSGISRSVASGSDAQQEMYGRIYT